jgi:hypothetical protein
MPVELVGSVLECGLSSNAFLAAGWIIIPNVDNLLLGNGERRPQDDSESERSQSYEQTQPFQLRAGVQRIGGSEPGTAEY